MSSGSAEHAASASAFLESERGRIEAAIERAIAAFESDAPPRIGQAVRYAAAAPGKRLRPALCVAAYRASDGRRAEIADAVYDAATALELIHTYSLVHDDLPCMDDDDLRRGRATTHRVHGDAVAALAGAAMIPAACAWLARACLALGLSDHAACAAVSELARAAGAGGMVGGQWLDLAAEGREISVAELEAIHARKTGALFAASLRLGGILAGSDEARLTTLGACGEALGLAFQVADDVLDEVGESEVLGKRAGADRAREKATFPALVGLEAARARARDAARSAISTLREGGFADATLESLIAFAVERDR